MTIHEFLQGDKFALLAGVELLETGNGYAKARMLIKPEHLNGGGAVSYTHLDVYKRQSHGLEMKSVAPTLMALTAFSISE